MRINALEKIFGSQRIKIMRLFLSNPEMIFDYPEISRRVKTAMPITRREISFLIGIEFIIPQRQKISELIKLKNGKAKNINKKASGFKLNPLFPFIIPMKNLIINAVSVDKNNLVKSLGKVGKMKLILLSGKLANSENSSIDLFLVADLVKKAKLDKVLSNLEAEMGKEITYALFNAEEFLYRFGMYDRFVRDILDYPHEKILNKLNI